MEIGTPLVRTLVARQFPQWAGLEVRPVATSGWDNRTFHLGDAMLVRLPSSEAYANQVEKEQRWLPILAPQVPARIPHPLAMGNADAGYPFRWSVYAWLDGDPATHDSVLDLGRFAIDIAAFLRALQRIDTTDAPVAGEANFHRGCPVAVYETQALEAFALLRHVHDQRVLETIWEAGANMAWAQPPVWIHGDVAASNLLVQDGQLAAVVDFGQLAVGDPACDLAIAWTFLDRASRHAFRDALAVDDATWRRGRCWALWKAAILRAEIATSNAAENARAERTLRDVIDDFKSEPVP